MLNGSGWAKQAKWITFLFKVDFDKALNSINWHFLELVMNQMCFGNRWRLWICGSLASSRAYALMNGVSKKEFPITRPFVKVIPFLHSFLSLSWKVLMLLWSHLFKTLYTPVLTFLIMGLPFHIFFMRTMQFLLAIGVIPISPIFLTFSSTLIFIKGLKLISISLRSLELESLPLMLSVVHT